MKLRIYMDGNGMWYVERRLLGFTLWRQRYSTHALAREAANWLKRAPAKEREFRRRAEQRHNEETL